MEGVEHLPHDADPTTPDVIERRRIIDGLFAESDRQIARILFRYMEEDDDNPLP